MKLLPSRFVKTFCCAFALLSLISVCRPGRAQVHAIDGRGVDVKLTSLPKRIVSLAPSNTEILFALGLKGRIVADTSQCNYPPEAAKLPHIGDYRISIEQVIARKPDLVVAMTSANRGAIQQLERLHMPVFAVDPGSIQETMDAIRKIGQITGADSQAARVVLSMEARVAALRRTLNNVRSLPKVLIVVQSQPLMVAGGKTFMDEIVTTAGGANLGRKSGMGYNLYSSERVIADPPDVIIGTADIGSKPGDRKSTRLNSSHLKLSRMPSSA